MNISSEHQALVNDQMERAQIRRMTAGGFSGEQYAAFTGDTYIPPTPEELAAFEEMRQEYRRRLGKPTTQPTERRL